MMQALLTCGLRLAEALRAENEALAAMDLTGAADISARKTAASDAFAAAWASVQKTEIATQGGLSSGAVAATDLADRLARLSAENRRLLEHAISLQAQVIETIAGAALPRAHQATYGHGGTRSVLRATPAVALSSRA